MRETQGLESNMVRETQGSETDMVRETQRSETNFIFSGGLMVKTAASLVCGVLDLGFIPNTRHIVQHGGWGLFQKTYTSNQWRENWYCVRLQHMCAGVASLAWGLYLLINSINVQKSNDCNNKYNLLL